MLISLSHWQCARQHHEGRRAKERHRHRNEPKGCQTHCQRQYGDWQHTLADAPEPERALRQWKTSQLTQMLGQKYQHDLKHDHVSGPQDSIAQPFDQPLTRTGDRQKIKAISLMYTQPSGRSPNKLGYSGEERSEEHTS